MHDGEVFKIYYYGVDSFEEDLPSFGAFLESLEKAGEKVIDVIPNTGFVNASILLGSSFQGVKGFAVLVKKN
jgi:hypothetical protein